MLFPLLSFLLGVSLFVILAGVLYQRCGLLLDRRRHPPPGRLVTIRTHSLHLYEVGSGNPTVVFESGLASSSLSWTLVQDPISRFTRTISYDRWGIGWSDELRQARSVESMVADLSLLLERSGNPGPYVLVGHSFGGLLVRAFASLHGEKIAGIVLVDPVSLEAWADCDATGQKRLRTGATLSRRGALLAHLGLVRLALTGLTAGRTRLPGMIAKISAGKAVGLMGRLTNVVRKLPPAAQLVVQAHWSQAKSFRAMADHLDILPASAKTARNMTVPSNIPITILSASDATPQELKERDAWVKWSPSGRHILVPDSCHWIQLEYPEQVIEAIAAMVENARA